MPHLHTQLYHNNYSLLLDPIVSCWKDLARLCCVSGNFADFRWISGGQLNFRMGILEEQDGVVLGVS